MIQSAIVKEGAELPRWDLGDFTLRPLRLGDENAWAEYLLDPRAIEHTSIPSVDLEAVRKSVERQVFEHSAATSARWALANGEDKLIGTCVFPEPSLVEARGLASGCSGRRSRAAAEPRRWADMEVAR